MCRPRRIVVVFACLVLATIIIHHLKSGFRQNNEFRSINGDEDDTHLKRLAILVPFRDRFDELLAFVPYIHKFLNNQNIGPFRIYILNQSHKYRFNRGALANVGFMLAQAQCDYIAIHDIDLIPINQNLSYAYPEKGPYHLTSPQYHPNYNYDKYFGGILLIKNEHFKLVNGFSNRYFGWGLEDDEFYTRVKAASLPITRPQGLVTGRNDTFLHFHYGRKRDMARSKEQSAALRYRDRETGLKDLTYSVTSSHNLTLDGQYPCSIFNIELHCDITKTPWCLNNRTRRINSKRMTNADSL